MPRAEELELIELWLSGGERAPGPQGLTALHGLLITDTWLSLALTPPPHGQPLIAVSFQKRAAGMFLHVFIFPSFSLSLSASLMSVYLALFLCLSNCLSSLPVYVHNTTSLPC